jgi:Y-X(10)_GDL-associated radical SAM protein
VHVVWELTLACNLRCSHCGSRASKRRPDELTTPEALEVVEHLARLGTRELSIIGGEAYLRRDWTQIIAAASGHGIFCGMQTGARALTDAGLRGGAQAGLRGIGVSLDGLRETHDRIRGVAGSFDHGLKTLERAKAFGMKTSVNTVISTETIDDLHGLLNELVTVGATHWQLQLVVAMGNAVDNPQLILQPYQLLELMPLLAELTIEARRRGVMIIAGNNIGYFGPFEHLWRTAVNGPEHWTGCSAGQTGMGIESDGTVKGCPSLPTLGFAGGNIRDMGLEDVWVASREAGGLRPEKELWGFCGGCYYKDVCRGGCTWTAHSLLGAAGNNPYCHHRALELQSRGRRERIEKIADAAPSSFAIGRFALVEEDLDGTDPTRTELTSATLAIIDATVGPNDPGNGRGRVPAQLRQCRGCSHFVLQSETQCPFCHGDLRRLERAHEDESARRHALIDHVEAAIAALAAHEPA